MKNLNFRKVVANHREGFTLIELLVVVAIIGVLASVILASLNGSRTRGADAAIKANLTNAIKQGEILYSTRTVDRDTYSGACANGTVAGALGVGSFVLSAAKAGGLSSVGYNNSPAASGIVATCNDSTNAWAAEVPLNGSTSGSPKMWCVDSTGKSLQRTTSIGATTVCP